MSKYPNQLHVKVPPQHAEMDSMQGEALGEALRRVHAKVTAPGTPERPHVDLVGMLGALTVVAQQHLEVARARLAAAHAQEERLNRLMSVLLRHPAVRGAIGPDAAHVLVPCSYETLRAIRYTDPELRKLCEVLLSREDEEAEEEHIAVQVQYDMLGAGLNRDEMEAY